METSALDFAFEELEQGVRDGDVPGAVAAVGTVDGTIRRAHYGLAQLTPQRRALTDDAHFDLASLTKIVVTATLALRLLEEGVVFLGQRIATVLPAFGAAGKDGVTVRHLLTHTSGLGSGLAQVHAIRQRALAPEGAAEANELTTARLPVLDLICALPLQRPIGSAVFYSDSGYFALGAFLAAVAQTPLDALAQREIFEPLGMRDTRFLPPPDVHHRAAATEVVPGRGGALVGQVHDEMAALAGGVAGHAGLFSTCTDLERFCRLWLGGGTLDGSRYLSTAAVAAATRDQSGCAVDPEGRPSLRGLGWSIPPNPRWHGGDVCSPASYGHTGFTGTSLLIDPQRGIYVVLLTNRIHPTRGGGNDGRAAQLRLRFYDRVWAALA